MPKAKEKATEESKPFDLDTYWLPLPEIAVMLDLSEERVRQFVKQGIFDRRENGDLHFQTCLHMYERYLLHPSWFKEAW
jgi:hypothetical protein